MSNYQLGGNTGTIALAGGYRDRPHNKNNDYKMISKKDLLECKMLADVEKARAMISFNSDRTSIDLRVYCTPVEYQYIYFTCTAFAVVGGIEFMNKRWALFDRICKEFNILKSLKKLDRNDYFKWDKEKADSFKTDIFKILKDKYGKKTAWTKRLGNDDVLKEKKWTEVIEVIESIEKDENSEKTEGNINSIITNYNFSDLVLSKLFAYRLAESNFQQEGPFTAFSIEDLISVTQTYGVCREKYWPYYPAYNNPGIFYTAPPAFCYREADNPNNQKPMTALDLEKIESVLKKQPDSNKLNDIDKLAGALTDLRSLTGRPEEKIINKQKEPASQSETKYKRPTTEIVKEMLYDYHLPVAASFYLYPSNFNNFLTSYTGFMPYPKEGEVADNGHCVLIVGYDDNIEVPAIVPGQETSRGAFLFKNSWSTGWGDDGYGWLSYEYFSDKGEWQDALVPEAWAICIPYFNPEEDEANRDKTEQDMRYRIFKKIEHNVFLENKS